MADRALAHIMLRARGSGRSSRSRWIRWALVGAFAVAALGFFAPVGILATGTARARRCVASISAPRGPELPNCTRDMSWFVTPSRVPWTSMAARYRAEELTLRAAIAAYEDAAIGRPSAVALERAADDLILAANVVRRGSQRVTIEELGQSVGAPDLARSAMLAGDRRTLIDRADTWEPWPVRLRALEAALVEGDTARATAIARRFAEFDPRDEDLRVAVAAILCRDGDAARAGELLTSVETARAQERHEAWARNWGEVRALIVACAAKAGKAPPPSPEKSDAGASDHLEARAVLRLRVLGRAVAGDPGDHPALRTAAYETIQMLKGLLPPGARVGLLAALLASGHAVDPALAASLAQPRTVDGETGPLPPPRTLTALDWLDETRGLRVSPSRQVLRHATDRLRRLAASTEISAEERLALETMATATALEAARAFALAGDAPGAIEIIDRAGARSLSNAAARALARSSAWYVTSDAGRALAELEHEPPDLRDDPGLQVAWWIQTAELCASVGRRDEAARAAVLADEAATLLGERGLEVRALWTRVALARAPLSALRAPAPTPLPGDRAWPWVGEMATAASWLAPGAESPTALARALGFWDAARRATPEEKRAIRYAAATAHRGDAPRALPAYLAVAAELLPQGEGDPEIWLDAFSATFARRPTMRMFAWSRAEAARFRGDAEAASRWTQRYRTLVRIAAEPDDAEIAAVLGI